MLSKLDIGSAVAGVRVASNDIVPNHLSIAGEVGFADGRIHEVEGYGATSVALAAAGATSNLVFWVGEEGATLGLRARGLAPHFETTRLVTVQTANRRETLWAGAEALRCAGAGLVIIQLDLGPDLFESRRLQVAAQVGGGLGIVLVARRAQTSAAQSRWHAEGRSGPDDTEHWSWRMTKNRRGKLKAWNVCCTRPPHLTLPPDLRFPTSPSVQNSIHDTHTVLATYTTTPCGVVSTASA